MAKTMSLSTYMTGIIVCMVVIVITERQLAAARTVSKRSSHEHNFHRHHKRCCLGSIDQASPKTLSNEVSIENESSYRELKALLKRAVCGHRRSTKGNPEEWLRLQDELYYDRCQNITCYSGKHCNCCCVQASAELSRPQDVTKKNVMSLEGCVCAKEVGEGTELKDHSDLNY